MNNKRFFYTVLALSPILLLSGCNPVKWFTGDKTEKVSKRSSKEESSASGSWIVKVDGKVVVTPQEFQDDFNALIDEKPQLKEMLPLMPNLEYDFARGLGNQKVISHFIEDNKIDQKKEYIVKKERMLNAVLQMLNAEFFSESFPTKELSYAQANKFYEENKQSMQGALVSKGGVTVSGVSFDKKSDADSFFKKVKDLKKFDRFLPRFSHIAFAKENNLGDNFKDFNMVNGQSFGIDPVLRSKLLSLKQFPKVDVLAVGDKTFWVVYATGKKEAQYRPFSEVKEDVKKGAQQTEKVKLLQGELEKLMKKYDVQINEDYFRQKASKANEQAAAIEAFQKKQAVVASNKSESPSLPATKTV